MNYNFHGKPVFNNLPNLLEPGLTTLQVAVLSMFLGMYFGMGLALIRMHGRGQLRWLATTWVEIARNRPALLQPYFFAFGLGASGLHLTPYVLVLTGLTFDNAGYLAGNFRGGLNAIPDTQVRAARSLGMTAPQAYLRIVIPQVLKTVYYPMTNQMVWAVLMSSLGMLVGFHELSGETQALASRTFIIFEYFAVTAVIYYVIAKIILGDEQSEHTQKFLANVR